MVRLEMRTAVCIMSPRPKTWMSTVSTINGKPHAQLPRQLEGLTTTVVKTSCAILIETIISRLLGSGDELSQIVMNSCAALQHKGQSLQAAPLLARCYWTSAALAAACFNFTRWRGCCAGRNFNLPRPVHYDCGPLGTVTCDSVVDYSFLDMESRGACRASGALNALQNIFHIAIDVLPELEQTTA